MDNISLFFLIFGLSSHSTLLDYLMIFGAEYLIYLMWFLIFIFAIRGTTRERKSLFLFLISFPVLILIIKFIHLFLFEQRPYVTNQILPLISYKAADASFPSRHASSSFAMAFAFLYYKSKWASLFLLLALWIGFARIYVGVHYPLDILGGFAVGVISVIFAKQIIKILIPKLF